MATICLIFLNADTAGAQQAVRSMDRDTLRTGDTFRYHVQLHDVDAYDEVIPPGQSDFGDDFIIRDLQMETDDESHQLIYTLQFFGIDIHAVPELYSGLREERDTLYLVIPETPFTYLPRVDDEEAQLRPLKPIFPFFINWWPWISAALIIAVLLACLLYRYRKHLFSRDIMAKQPKPVMEPFRNPLKELRTKLKRIERTFADDPEQVKNFYTELGDAFRTYFEEAHHFPALESTTGEIVRELENRRFEKNIIRLTADVLLEADLVKFAKYHPNESECKDVMKKAKFLAEQITETDKLQIEAMLNRHLEEQKQKLSELNRHDLG